METTFILAQKLNVSPFEIMAQDVEAVIMVINHFVESAENHKEENNNSLTEKERDSGFWDAI